MSIHGKIFSAFTSAFSRYYNKINLNFKQDIKEISVFIQHIEKE
jgi:hypothetical protein